MRYVAYAVDTFGVALATYEFLCANDADAEHRAGKLLDAHQTIEIWQGTRRVVALPEMVTEDAGARTMARMDRIEWISPRWWSSNWRCWPLLFGHGDLLAKLTAR